MTEETDPKPPAGVPADRNEEREERIRADGIIDDETGDGEIGEGEMSEAEIDRNLMGSFPASDPPSWTLGIRDKDPTDE